MKSYHAYLEILKLVDGTFGDLAVELTLDCLQDPWVLQGVGSCQALIDVLLHELSDQVLGLVAYS